MCVSPWITSTVRLRKRRKQAFWQAVHLSLYVYVFVQIKALVRKVGIFGNKKNLIKIKNGNNHKSIMCVFVCALHISHLIRWGIFVEVKRWGWLPQQGFEWSNLRGAAGAAVWGARDGSMDGCDYLGLLRRYVPRKQFKLHALYYSTCYWLIG